jgi:WXG100 family type VII secretion target
MPATRIRADHDSLTRLAKSFAGRADATRQTISKLKRCNDILQGGDWVGKGANKFYSEMDSSVMPSLNRLAKSLDKASQVTLKIAQIMRQADDDIARIMRPDANGSSLGAIAGAVVGGIMGGAVGGAIGAAAGAAAGSAIGDAIGGGSASGGGAGSGGSSGSGGEYQDTFPSPEADAKVAEIHQKARELREAHDRDEDSQQIKDELLALTTHGSGDRAVIGKGGEIPEWADDAKKNGGIWYENPQGYYEIVGPELAWDMNQLFLQRQLESGIPKIDYVGEPVEQVLTDPTIRGKTRWREVKYLEENAAQYGYERQGNSWVKVR